MGQNSQIERCEEPQPGDVPMPYAKPKYSPKTLAAAKRAAAKTSSRESGIIKENPIGGDCAFPG